MSRLTLLQLEMVGRTYLVSQYAISVHWPGDVSLSSGLLRLAGKLVVQFYEHAAQHEPPQFQMSATLKTKRDFYYGSTCQ